MRQKLGIISIVVFLVYAFTNPVSFTDLKIIVSLYIFVNTTLRLQFEILFYRFLKQRYILIFLHRVCFKFSFLVSSKLINMNSCLYR